MSDLDEIAKAAGIIIIDENPGDGGDADNTHQEPDSFAGAEKPMDPSGDPCDDQFSSEIAALEAMFPDRYTMSDPEYAQVVEDSETTLRQPCVAGFRPRRSRGQYRNRGGWGGGRGGGHHQDNRFNHHHRDNRSWDNKNGGDRRDWGDRGGRGDWGDRRGRGNWGDREGKRDWGDRGGRRDWGDRGGRRDWGDGRDRRDQPWEGARR